MLTSLFINQRLPEYTRLHKRLGVWAIVNLKVIVREIIIKGYQCSWRKRVQGATVNKQQKPTQSVPGQEDSHDY